MENKNIDGMPLITLRRLTMYLDYLEKLNVEYVSAPMIAKELDIKEIVVKKDLAYCTSKQGKPKLGHRVEDLICDIKDFLGYDNYSKAVLVGTGKLGQALLGYDGFKKSGIEIVVAFDNDPYLIGQDVHGVKVCDINKLGDLCKRMGIHIGIITTSSTSAQDVCDIMVSSGVQAIWNFATSYLKVPDDVIVQNENLAASLAVLSKKITEKNK